MWFKSKPNTSDEVIYLRSQVSDLQAQVVQLTNQIAELNNAHARALTELAQGIVETFRPKAFPQKTTKPAEATLPGSRPDLRPPEPIDEALTRLTFGAEQQAAETATSGSTN